MRYFPLLLILLVGCLPGEMLRDAPAPANAPAPVTPVDEPDSTAEQSAGTDGELAVDLLNGNWKVDTIEFRGQSQRPQPGMPETIEISDGVFNADSGGTPIKTFSQMRIEINVGAEHNELELVREKDGQVDSLPCIFKLSEEKLQIAMPMIPSNKTPGQVLPRPVSFDTNTAPFMVLTATRLR